MGWDYEEILVMAAIGALKCLQADVKALEQAVKAQPSPVSK